MAVRLIEVPGSVARTAAAALDERAGTGGGTRSAVMVASALATGYLTPRELAELRHWHQSNPLDGSILARLHGGDHARFWHGSAVHIAAAMNPASEGAMVALPVPDDIAQMLERPDGEPAAEMHVTLFHFGGDAADLPDGLRDSVLVALQDATRGLAPPVVSLTHIERFSENDDGVEPVAAVSDSPDVYALRATIEERFSAAGVAFSDDHAFRCHVTIGYYLPGEGPPAGPVAQPLTWTPDTVALHWGAEVEPFPLAGSANPADNIGADPTPQTAGARSPLRDRLAKMSTTVNGIDRRTRLKLHSGATVAYQEALRQAGVKVAQRARTRTGAQRSVLAAAGGRITEPVLAALGLDDSALLDKRFDTFGVYALGVLAAAERRKIRAAASALGLDPDDVEGEYAGEIDRRATAAAGMLVASLGVLARNALAGNPLSDATPGEYAGPVPFSVVRDAFATATRGAPVPVVDQSGPGPTDISDLVSGLTEAGTSLVQDLLAVADVQVQVRTTWTAGDPERPFAPHQDLDGLSWVDTQPVELDWDSGEFPYVDVLQPGDHDGCQCELVEDYEPYEGDAGDGDTTPALVSASEGTPA